MIEDFIKRPYIGHMRAFDGSIFPVAWFEVPITNKVDERVHPFRSGRFDPYAPFDMGFVGEIPEFNPPWSYVKVPDNVCHDCSVGDDDWWENGWPSDAPPVVLNPDGFATGCVNPPMPVTKVGLAMPPEFAVSGSPVTSIGVLTADWLNVPPGFVLSGPVSGPNAKPTFKAPGTPPLVPPILGRLTGGPQANPNLISPLIPATWSTVSDLVIFTNPADAIHCQAGSYIQTSGGVEVGFVKHYTINPSTGVGTAELYVNSFSSGPGSVQVLPLTVTWIEQQFDPFTGLLTDKPGGIVGTPTANPAMNMETTYVDMSQCFALLWKRGTCQGIDVYEFTKYANDVVNGGSIDIGPVTLNPPAAGPPGPPTAPNTLYVDPITFNLQYINNSGLVVIVVNNSFGGGNAQGLFGNVTGTSSSGFVSLMTAAGTTLTGVIGFTTLAGSNVRFQITGHDFRGNPYLFPIALSPGQVQNVDLSTIFSGGVFSPLTDVELQVQDQTSGSHGTYRAAWCILGG